VFLKFVKIREFYKFLKFIKFAFSVYDFTSNPTTLNPNPNQGAVDFRSRYPGGGRQMPGYGLLLLLLLLLLLARRLLRRWRACVRPRRRD